jgi:hypothetical protein
MIKSNIGLALMESGANPLVERVATALSNAARATPPNLEKIKEILSALGLKKIQPEHLSGSSALPDRQNPGMSVLFIWHKPSGNPVPGLRSFKTSRGGNGSILPGVEERINKIGTVNLVELTDVPPPPPRVREVLPDELPAGESADGLEKKIVDVISVALRGARGKKRQIVLDRVDQILALFGLPPTDRKTFRNISFGDARGGHVPMFINKKGVWRSPYGFSVGPDDEDESTEPLQISFDGLERDQRGFYVVNGIRMKPYGDGERGGIFIPEAERLLRKIPKDKLETLLDNINNSEEKDQKNTVNFERVRGVGETYGKLLSYMSIGLGLTPRPEIIEQTEKLIERLIREGTGRDSLRLPRISKIEPHPQGVKFVFGNGLSQKDPVRLRALGTDFDLTEGSIIIHDFETFFGTHRDFARGSSFMRHVIDLGERLGVLEE